VKQLPLRTYLAALVLASLVCALGCVSALAGGTGVTQVLGGLTAGVGLLLAAFTAAALLTAERARPLVEKAADEQVNPKRPDLWMLEIIYNDFRIHRKFLREHIAAARQEGRKAFVDGQINDQQLVQWQGRLDDIKQWQELLVAGYVRAGGDYEHLRAQYERAAKRDPELEADLDASANDRRLLYATSLKS
jgi:hypothetical protein